MAEENAYYKVWAPLNKPMMTLFFENNGDIGALAEAWGSTFSKSHATRQVMVKKYGWSIPSNEILEAIVEFAGDKTILDVGAGTGYWAKLLEEKGAKVIAIDDKSESTSETHFDIIEQDGVDYLKNEPSSKDACLFVSWARQPFWQHFKGNKVVWIGEMQTNKDDLRSYGWKREKEMNIPQWEAIHDFAAFYTR